MFLVKMFKKIFFLTIVLAIFYIIATRPELPQSETSPIDKPGACLFYFFSFI